MPDATKKGVLLVCSACRKKTRMQVTPDKKEKMIWLRCECGNWELIDHWS